MHMSIENFVIWKTMGFSAKLLIKYKYQGAFLSYERCRPISLLLFRIYESIYMEKSDESVTDKFKWNVRFSHLYAKKYSPKNSLVERCTKNTTVLCIKQAKIPIDMDRKMVSSLSVAVRPHNIQIEIPISKIKLHSVSRLSSVPHPSIQIDLNI